MTRVIALLLVLSGCASQPSVTPLPDVPRPQTLGQLAPATMLKCKPEPDGAAVATIRQTARYVVDLRGAGADCRRKLDSVRALVIDENHTP